MRLLGVILRYAQPGAERATTSDYKSAAVCPRHEPIATAQVAALFPDVPAEHIAEWSLGTLPESLAWVECKGCASARP